MKANNIIYLFKPSVLFPVSYFIYMFKMIIMATTIDAVIINFIQYAGNILFFVMLSGYFFVCSVKSKLYILMVCLVLFSNYIVFHLDWFAPIIVFVFFALMSMELTYKKIIINVFYINILLFFIILPFLFLSTNYYLYDIRYVRYTFGFGHPNVAGLYLLSFYFSVSMFFSIKIKQKFGAFIIITIIALSFLYVIELTKSRTSELCMFFIYFGFIYSVILRTSFVERKYPHVFILVVLSICILQFWIARGFMDGSSLAVLINTLLSDRGMYSAALLSAKGYPSFFHGINSSSYDPLDFFFIKYFYSTGLLIGVILLFSFYKKIKSFNQALPLIVALPSLAFLSVTFCENQILEPINALALFLLASRKDL